MQLEGGGEKKNWLNTFCHLCNSACDLQDCQDQPEDKGHERNGRKHQEFTWWCANCPNPMVSFFSSNFSSWLIINLISYSNHAAWFISAYDQGLSGLDSGGCMGKLEISWPPNITSRNGPQSWKMNMRRDMMHRPILYNIFRHFSAHICNQIFFFWKSIFCHSWHLYNHIT